MGLHCYADRDLFWQYLSTAGMADEYRADDLLLLSFLQGSSRAVDAFCRRTGWKHPTSGFGPRQGVSYYDGAGGTELDLNDDLLSLTTFEVADRTGGSFTAWAEGTDFLLIPYDVRPARYVDLEDVGSRTLPTGRKVIRATGTWGYADTRAALAAAVPAGGWTDSATTVSFTDASEIALGQTLWCGTEALYVTDLSGAGATVVRGAHGTTAAAHTQGATLARQTYDPDVVVATLQIAARRWKHRETGLSGDYGGQGGVPTVSEKARENDILRSIVGHLAFQGRT